jgi:predicted branched-subunit amino acid permease
VLDCRIRRARAAGIAYRTGTFPDAESAVVQPQTPAKTNHSKGQRGTAANAFVRGLLVVLTIPGLILFASSAGFGALARDGGLSLTNALVMMAALFALPAQVVMVDQLARGGSLLAAALAVMVTGVRMLPMTVTLAPYLKSRTHSRIWPLVATHCIAITAWIEGSRRLPSEPAETRLVLYLGLGAGLIASSLIGTVGGYVIAGALPTVLAATLLFLTPIYFILSLVATAKVSADWIAIAIGALLGPVLFILMPGFDLLATGLIGGTAAHFLGRQVLKLDDDT